MAFVELKNLKKDFSGQKVINDISLQIHQGELLVLVGPSGCGKSTLLRMIAGLEQQSSGNIIISGKNVDKLEPKDRNISMVFQNYALYPHLNVAENMAFGLKLAGKNKNEIEGKVKKTAEILQMSDLLERKPKELSGGQRQRVALGRAIIRDTSLILFDEPLSNLDAHLRSQMRYEIKRLHQLTGCTMVYVTHDQTEATTLGDRIAILNKGQIVQIDSAQNIYENPTDLFVASFIGSPEINLIPGELLGMNKDELIGIRPEDIRILSQKSENSFEVKVDVQEYLGANCLLYAILSNKMMIRILAQNQMHFKNGQSIYIDFNLTRTIHFDKSSSRNKKA